MINSALHIFLFDPENYKPESKTITLHGPTEHREDVFVKSRSTGIAKLFHYDRAETSKEYMNNEGWDGEQNLSIYFNSETNVYLRVWDTPYDEW